MAERIQTRLQRLVRRVFGAPFQKLPASFGDSVPSDLRVFEAEVEERRHHVQEAPSPTSAGQGRTKAARRREFLDRL